MGKIIIIIGVIIVIIGLVIHFTNFNLNWFGRLPGDVRIEKGNSGFYFPITTMIIVSGVISGVLWIIRKINF